MAGLLTLSAYVAIVVGFLSYISFRYSRRRLYKLSNSMAGRPQLPFIGNAYQFAGSTEDIAINTNKVIDVSLKNDGVSKTWLGPRLFITLTNPYDAEIVLNTEMKKADVYRFMKPWLGNGLVSAPVPIWKLHRRMLSPTFNPKILHGFVNIFAEQGEILVNKMSAEVGKGEFDLFKYVGECTLDIICESVMGLKVHGDNNKNSPYIKAGLREMSLICRRIYQIWLQPEFLFQFSRYYKQEKHDLNVLHTFTDAVVQAKKKEYNQRLENEKQCIEFVEHSKFKAFLDLMIECNEKGKTLSDVELREEVDTMTIAGNDTSAHASSFVLVMLACMPEIQEKVVEELRGIYGDSKRPVEKDDLSKMEYLERVIKETLRLYPIVPALVRELTQDVKIRNYTLPAGAGVVVGVRGLHRDKDVWGENADEFDPDRFLPENCAKRHPYSYIPFSAGPRNCIGRQYAMYSLKSLISTIVRRYKLSSSLDHKNLRVKTDIICKPVLGHILSIDHRLNF